MMKVQDVDAIICTHCLNDEAEIFEVAYTADDNIYQFLCETHHHDENSGYPIHSQHIFSENTDLEFFKYIKTSFLANRLNNPAGWILRYVNIDHVPDDFSLFNERE